MSSDALFGGMKGQNILLGEMMNKEEFKATKFGQVLVTAKRMIRQPEYRQWLQDYDLCHTMFKIEEFGPQNIGKVLYVIKNTGPYSGLFHSLFHACRGLLVADRCGFVPVIDWDQSPYLDENSSLGNNAFEYYFDPPSSVPPELAMQSRNVVFYNRHTDGNSFSLYSEQKEEELNEMARACAKYLHIRSELFNELCSEIHALLKGKKTLAVHVRGVEWGNVAGHPIPVALGEYASQIDIALADHGFEQIFLATDSDDTIAFFKDRFPGGLLVYYRDVVRTKTGSHILVIYDKAIQRENNGYLLGREVLKDMLTLSYCDGIVAGMSYVRLMAEVFKRSRGETYQFKSMVEQQISKNGIPSIELVDSKSG